MPRGDRTGPHGLGPMTGRAAGYCAGYPTPGFMTPGGGRGMGRRRGAGFGRGHGFSAYPAPNPAVYPPQSYADEPPAAPDTELAALREQAEFITRSLETLAERIDQLEATRQVPEEE